MVIPQGKHIVAVECQLIKILLPEFPIPHVFDVVLRRIPGIVIAWCSGIQGYVELNAPLLYVRGMAGIFNTSIKLDLLGNLKSTVHESIQAPGTDPYLIPGTFNRITFILRPSLIKMEDILHRILIYCRISRFGCLDGLDGKGHPGILQVPGKDGFLPPAGEKEDGEREQYQVSHGFFSLVLRTISNEGLLSCQDMDKAFHRISTAREIQFNPRIPRY